MGLGGGPEKLVQRERFNPGTRLVQRAGAGAPTRQQDDGCRQTHQEQNNGLTMGWNHRHQFQTRRIMTESAAAAASKAADQR